MKIVICKLRVGICNYC